MVKLWYICLASLTVKFNYKILLTVQNTPCLESSYSMLPLGEGPKHFLWKQTGREGGIVPILQTKQLDSWETKWRAQS